MQKYFNVNIEFDKSIIDQQLFSSILKKKSAYVCVIESNNLTEANVSTEFDGVVNNSLLNICDGSVLALILSYLYKQSLQPCIGGDLFIKYIKKRKYKHYFLGNTQIVLEGLRQKLSLLDPNIENMPFVELPFLPVTDFDYPRIAAEISTNKPDMIWISLGAPKQEIFMSKLLPYLDQGIMFGIGAAFNFYARVGHVKRAPKWMLKLKLEWLYRAFEEPKKNIPRYWRFVKILPKLIFEEKRKIRKQANCQ